MATKTIDIGNLARATPEEASQLRPMPGLDLRVFKQNQKLRLENQRLTDEVDRLGSKNVQLVFQVREMETRANRFLEQLHGAEQERARAQRLEVELLDARREIENLQTLVLDLKEECLARLSSHEPPTPPPVAREQTPFESLCRALSSAMGLMGRSLVEQVFERLDLARETSDSEALREVLEQLRMMAPHLATSAEQLQRSQEALGRFEAQLAEPSPPPTGLLARVMSANPSALPGSHLAPKTVAPPLANHPQAPCVPAAPVRPAPLKNDAVSAILASVAQPPSVTPSPAPPRVSAEPAPGHAVHESAPIRTAPTSPKTEISRTQSLLHEMSARPGLRPAAPVSETRPSPRLARREGQPEGLHLTADPELLAELEQLGPLSDEERLKKLVRLEREHPQVVQVRRALVLSHVQAQNWAQAREAAQGLEPWVTDAEEKKEFLETVTHVLRELLQQLRSAAEKKKVLLELAELHLEQPKQAVRFLRQAEILPDRIPGGGRIDYHLTSLLAGGLEDRSGYLLNYMKSLHDRVELFEHVRDIYRQPQHSRHLGVAETVVAMGRRPRTQAEEFERRAATRLAPKVPDASTLEQAGNPIEESVVRFTLDHLLAQAGLQVAAVPESLLARLKDSVPAPDSSPVHRVAREANQAFAFKSLDLRRYQGPENFLVDAGPCGQGVTLVYHPELESLPPNEVRFLVYRTLFAHHRRHLQLHACAAALDDSKRYRLVKTYLELFKNAGAPVPAELVAEVEALPGLKVDFGLRLARVLEQLYKQTRSDAFLDLKEFLFAPRPFSEHLDRLADQFACSASGLTSACYALAREALGRGNALMLRLEREGFQLLYLGEEASACSDLRQRLQWLWAHRLEG